MKTFFKRSPRKLMPREGYDKWSQSYEVEENPIRDASIRLVKEMLPDLESKSVLDAGCGTGYFCALAEQLGASRIVGVDLSPKMIQRAKSNCVYTEFVCADLSEYRPSSNIFDVILCALMLGHIENIDPVFNMFANSLNPGGCVVLTDFHPMQTLRNAKRTFKDLASNTTFEIQHYLHHLSKIKSVVNQNELVVEKVEELRYNDVPVVFGMKIVKS